MLKNASTTTRHHHSRGTRIESPLHFATSSMPIAANGSVIARNVSGAISADADLEHRPVAAPDQRRGWRSARTRARAGCRAGDRPSTLAHGQRLAELGLVQRARLRDPARRAGCARETPRSRASNSSMSRSLQRAIWRYVVTPSWCSIRSSTGPMPTMSLRSSGAFGTVEQRRRGVVLEVDARASR